MLKILMAVCLIFPMYAFAESSQQSRPLWSCGTKPLVQTKEQIEAERKKARERVEKMKAARLARMQKSNESISENSTLDDQNCKSGDCLNSGENKSIRSGIDSTYIRPAK